MFSTRRYTIPLFVLAIMLFNGCGGGKSVSVKEKGEPKITYGRVAEIISGPTQLTFESANNGIGSYNPDGSTIVFQSDRDGRWQIYQLDPADGSSQRLIESKFNDENPVWIPDASGFLFVSDRSSGGDEWGRDIFFFDAGSKVIATMTDDAADDWYPVPLDADNYLFLSERGAAEGLPDYATPNKLFKGGLEGNTPDELVGTEVDPSAPAVYDDKHLIVRNREGQIALLDTGDGSQVALTPSGMRCGTLSYNRQRKLAAMTALEADAYSLFLFDISDRKLQKVDTGEGEVRYPQISPNGSRILFSREVDGYFQLFQLELAQ